MGEMLAVAGLAALFAGIFATALLLVTGNQDRAGVAQTVRTVGQGYRIAPPPGAGQQASGGSPAASAGLRVPVVRRLTALARALTPAAGFARLGQRLDQAGNPASLTADAVMEYKGVFGVIGLLAGLTLGLLSSGPVGVLLWTIGGGAAGFFGPNLLVTHLAQERQQHIRRTLPDIIDTLVVTVEAGLGFEAALAHIVRSGRGPVPREFARLLHEMQLGASRVNALRDLTARTTVAELRAFSSVVIQATTLGIPLGGVLRQQSAETRLRRQQRAEELAQKVPVKILFPMILCIFPALFVVVLGPGIIKAMGMFGN
ncbi:MAG: type II secretion system F family protein [Micromonosporaceae bacterium]|nr:type II secretion system F family protein [Micromonosporaceae bacterium]